MGGKPDGRHYRVVTSISRSVPQSIQLVNIMLDFVRSRKIVSDYLSM